MNEIKINKLNKLSNENLEDIFAIAFEKNIASRNNISEFECHCVRDSSNSTIKMEVTIIGMANSPIMEKFANGEIKEAITIMLSKEDMNNKIIFKLLPQECINLNTNDYMLVYQLM